LRYLLLVAALLTPRPPELLVLNEPETSLHPELLAPLAALIGRASERTQTVVVSHAAPLTAAIEATADELGLDCAMVALVKEQGETKVAGQGILDGPPWHWPKR
jgi:predicted ATPase